MTSSFSTEKTCGFLSPLPLNASRQKLLAAVVDKLCITKKIKSFKGACVHHGALEGQIFACPVKALARQVSHICVHTSYETTFLCEYWNSIGRGNVTDRDISFYMKITAEKLGYPIRNILPDRIDTYSNQAGGACAMKLAGFDDGSIRKMGIWLPLLNYFLEYIQQHISGLSQGMATKMSRIEIFTNIGGSENHTG